MLGKVNFQNNLLLNFHYSPLLCNIIQLSTLISLFINTIFQYKLFRNRAKLKNTTKYCTVYRNLCTSITIKIHFYLNNIIAFFFLPIQAPINLEYKLTIYDMLERKIVILFKGKKIPGHYTARWNANEYAS